MIKKLPKELQAVILENNGLKQYLSNLSKGRDATPRSWLYEDREPADVLNEWKNILVALDKGDTFEKRVYQFDISSEEKWGPQGKIAPMDELLDDVVLPTFEAHSPKPKAFDTIEWDDAVAKVAAELNIRALRPASYERVLDDMRARDTLESNSGWPLFTRRRKPEVVVASIRNAESGVWERYPAIALFRNYRQKTRLVWMFPMSANLVEGSFFQPFQRAIISRNLDFYAPWDGFEKVRRVITAAYASGKVIAASDFSATDAHFQLSSTLAVLPLFKQAFQRQYAADIERSLQNMHLIPLVISPTEWVVGQHGVSSGSNWTNFVETLFDHTFSKYVEEWMGYPKGLYAIGDDMAWVMPRYNENFSKDLEKYGADVGQIVKAEKTTNNPDSVKTLQRLFQRGYNRPDGLCRGVYPTIRALNSLIFPEKFHRPEDWSSDMFCARTYMILENCVDHPLFEQFVRFVVKGQKDLIPFAHKSGAELARITRKTKLLPGLNPTYNAEKRDTSLASFESVKLAAGI